MEDYLKAIFHLHKKESSGAVHLSDVAKRLCVSKPSVFRAVDFLVEEGLLRKAKFREIYLTPEGANRAEFIAERYNVIERFLNEILRMDLEKAQIDACGIEHVISKECYKSMQVFLKDETTPGCDIVT